MLEDTKDVLNAIVGRSMARIKKFLFIGRAMLIIWSNILYFSILQDGSAHHDMGGAADHKHQTLHLLDNAFPLEPQNYS